MGTIATASPHGAGKLVSGKLYYLPLSRSVTPPTHTLCTNSAASLKWPTWVTSTLDSPTPPHPPPPPPPTPCSAPLSVSQHFLIEMLQHPLYIPLPLLSGSHFLIVIAVASGPGPAQLSLSQLEIEQWLDERNLCPHISLPAGRAP
jgi:hypothetical protein